MDCVRRDEIQCQRGSTAIGMLANQYMQVGILFVSVVAFLCAHLLESAKFGEKRSQMERLTATFKDTSARHGHSSMLTF